MKMGKYTQWCSWERSASNGTHAAQTVLCEGPQGSEMPASSPDFPRLPRALPGTHSPLRDRRVDGRMGERGPARTPPRRRVLGQATPFCSWESAHRFQGRKCTVLRVTNWQLKSLR